MLKQRLFLFVISLAPILSLTADEPHRLSPVTVQAVEQMRKLDEEAGHYGCFVSESLIFCSRVQDALVAYLHSAEDRDAFFDGMHQLDGQCDGFRSVCNWVTSVINFYNPRAPQLPSPHREHVVTFRGETCSAFYNTFKTGRNLTHQEREHFFQKELGLYLRDGVADRFMLNAVTFQDLEPEMIYNFVLLPDGKMWAALERPGGKEYHIGENEILEEAFGYPNHTILAGAPDQLVLTAGAFILFVEGEKKLMFLSNKSGHYQPPFRSLPEARRQIATFGIDEHAIIPVPDVDLAGAVLKLYNKAQVPVAVAAHDSHRLLNIARKRWIEVYNGLDRSIIEMLARGEFDEIDQKVKESLARCREEATYTRSAYQLFTAEHKAPALFHRLVLCFGKLKDALHHEVWDRAQREAKRLIPLMQRYDQLLLVEEIFPADAESFYAYLTGLIDELEGMIERKTLSIDDYHLVKKGARELGALFLMLADDVQWRGENYFLFRASALAFLQVNEHMRAVHDAYVGQVMRGEIEKVSTEVTLSDRDCMELTQYIGHLGIAPPRAEIEIDPTTAWWLINYAKEWYLAHYNLSSPPSPHGGARAGSYEPCVRTMLEQIIAGEWEEEDERALVLLSNLKRLAEISRNSLLLLDENHAPPAVIDDYIETIDRVVRGIRAGKIDEIVSDASELHALLSDMGVPTRALEEWVCTDQDGFNRAMRAALSRLQILQVGEVLSPKEMRASRDAAQAIADLMHLYRRCGLKYQSLPTAFYDTVAHECDLLVAEIDRLLDRSEPWIAVTHECALHAALVVARMAS